MVVELGDRGVVGREGLVHQFESGAWKSVEEEVDQVVKSACHDLAGVIPHGGANLGALGRVLRPRFLDFLRQRDDLLKTIDKYEAARPKLDGLTLGEVVSAAVKNSDHPDAQALASKIVEDMIEDGVLVEKAPIDVVVAAIQAEMSLVFVERDMWKRIASGVSSVPVGPPESGPSGYGKVCIHCEGGWIPIETKQCGGCGRSG